MKFNTLIPAEKKEAMSYFMRLVNKRQIVEVKKVSPNRTLNQNSYLHLLLGYFAQHFGWDMDEAKTIYKRWAQEVYYYQKNGQSFLRSSASLSVDEMTQTIDIFRRRSAEEGLPLPTATDQGWLREIEKEIDRSKYNR